MIRHLYDAYLSSLSVNQRKVALSANDFLDLDGVKPLWQSGAVFDSTTLACDEACATR